MKKSLALATMAALIASGGNSGTIPNYYDEPPESDEDKNKKRLKADEDRNKSRGLTQFFYGENSLWALNKKSAERKAKNKGWI